MRTRKHATYVRPRASSFTMALSCVAPCDLRIAIAHASDSGNCARDCALTCGPSPPTCVVCTGTGTSFAPNKNWGQLVSCDKLRCAFLVDRALPLGISTRGRAPNKKSAPFCGVGSFEPSRALTWDAQHWTESQVTPRDYVAHGARASRALLLWMRSVGSHPKKERAILCVTSSRRVPNR